MNYYYTSPIGKLFISFEDDKLTGIWFEKQKHFPSFFQKDKAGAILDSTNPHALELSSWLDAYFNRENPKLPNIDLDPQGSDFQKLVWQELLNIPYGETIGYGEIAASLQQKGRLTSPRAVGSAVGRNPISILIPCHRVIAADGKLTGYAGGIDRKVALLRLEGIIAGDGLMA